MNSTSLYIHIPWCIRKCPYCDFNSHKSPKEIPERDYINALVNDFISDLQFLPSREISSIFIGGGTPSLFSATAYAELFDRLQQLVLFKPNIEITLEANPGTVEQERFNAYRQLGINRLSLGIQSFNPQHLKKLGRIHDDKQAHNAIQSARKAGFDNINIDIMHGLPEQSVAEGLTDLALALSYKPEHLSWYQLTLEPNTVFYKQQPTLPPEPVMEELEQSGFKLLEQEGLHRYEISAFSKINLQSQHNLNYWRFGDYYGIGAGAHSKLSFENKVVRINKQRQPNDYLHNEKKFIAATSTLAHSDLLFEFMLNTTRLEHEIPYTLFNETTGLPISSLMVKLEQAQAKNLITLGRTSWRVTALGRRFTDNLQAIFLP